jgi:hypothetical protein
VVVQIPYTWGYVDSINRIRRDTGKVVEVVSTWGNQKAISGGMGRVFRKKKLYYPNPNPKLTLTRRVIGRPGREKSALLAKRGAQSAPEQ